MNVISSCKQGTQSSTDAATVDVEVEMKKINDDKVMFLYSLFISPLKFVIEKGLQFQASFFRLE